MGNNSGSFLTLNRTAGSEPVLAFSTDNVFKGSIRGLITGGLHLTDATGGVDYMRITCFLIRERVATTGALVLGGDSCERCTGKRQIAWVMLR
jgi:hypothetical protein